MLRLEVNWQEQQPAIPGSTASSRPLDMRTLTQGSPTLASHPVPLTRMRAGPHYHQASGQVRAFALQESVPFLFRLRAWMYCFEACPSRSFGGRPPPTPCRWSRDVGGVRRRAAGRFDLNADAQHLTNEGLRGSVGQPRPVHALQGQPEHGPCTGRQDH